MYVGPCRKSYHANSRNYKLSLPKLIMSRLYTADLHGRSSHSMIIRLPVTSVSSLQCKVKGSCFLPSHSEKPGEKSTRTSESCDTNVTVISLAGQFRHQVPNGGQTRGDSHPSCANRIGWVLSTKLGRGPSAHQYFEQILFQSSMRL